MLIPDHIHHILVLGHAYFQSFLSGFQPLTPALMHYCSQNTPPRENWEKDSSRPSLMPKDSGCCDTSTKKVFWLNCYNKREYHKNPLWNDTKQNAATARCLISPRPFILHFHAEDTLSLTASFLYSELHFPKSLTRYFRNLFILVFCFRANMNNIWFVKLWKCTYTQDFSECEHTPYV